MQPTARNVEEFRSRQARVLEQFGAAEAHLSGEHAHDPRQVYWLMTLRCGIRVHQAFVDWCDETLRTLQALKESRGV